MLSIKVPLYIKLRTNFNKNNDIYDFLRLCSMKYSFMQKSQYSTKKYVDENIVYKIDPKVIALRDKILYSEYLSYEKIKLGYLKRLKLRNKLEKIQEEKRVIQQVNEPVFSVMLNRINNNICTDFKTKNEIETLSDPDDRESRKIIHMPYAFTDSFKIVDTPADIVKNIPKDTDDKLSLNEIYKNLYEKYLEATNSIQGKEKPSFVEYEEIYLEKKFKNLQNVAHKWMDDYEQYDDMQENSSDWLYGSPNENTQISSIPCGGCGALLHCKDHTLPGYLPSELFVGITDEELKNMICQRCHFLKHYNTALKVKVSSEDYPELLKVIKTKKCAVILIIDLTDFPCSIWPNIGSILHRHTPVFVVGNKIDLLPKDSPTFESHVKMCISKAIENAGIGQNNIKHISLISAKTGYGIENFINKLHKLWRYKGDVFLIGCTNVGKSSLFNDLLHSDYCKVQAVDLVQRATISPWPGTTLNLLKFPILNFSKWRLYQRTLRLKAEKENQHAKQYIQNYQFKLSHNIKYAILQGVVGKTFTSCNINNSKNIGIISLSSKFNKDKFGLDETRPEYKCSRWCYDTPGTIQPDQIMDLLTIEEIIETLPNKIISPRTFLVQPEETIFIGGLGRLDYLEGNVYIRCTIFASSKLPITMCRVSDADYLYKELLHTQAFVVPINNPQRLKVWPPLQSKQFEITGINETESAADIVLSNAGWIAVTPKENEKVKLQGWTPCARGIHLRTPALLKKSVTLRGARVARTPAYKKGRQVYLKESI
ncbi:nitric oxide-associated protein 1-like [Vespa mandarinia]|uniref:nitric oxide-associated protein 1-like n=1 Tax=Vespa mandarinia TaxID=7446 RepID=UPI00161A2E40|nr:nitric oxide-associated protein 1-like [Vespa mandarinia]